MSNLHRCVNLLKENEESVYTEAQRVLSTLCNNIIKNPSEAKYRKVRLNNPTVMQKLLPASGAMECLFEIGFIESDDHLLMPETAPLNRLQELAKLLSDPRTKQTKEVQRMPEEAQCMSESRRTPAPIPQVQGLSFFAEIKSHFQDVLRYEDPNLQERAKSLVPLAELEIEAMKKMRSIQRDMKLNGDDKSMDDIAMEDLILAELLRWFKEKFFQWVDSPPCTACSGASTFQRVVRSSVPGISRIEIHRCGTCGTQVQFPRYSDPGLLLCSRKGRCGEWANAFTLICRSLGYDVRLVWDKTDHVWTEVWSMASNRWIHADPCENAMDRPLIYEKGWGKKLSYILAFSKDEVQDVTWRYTLDQSAVMKRRMLCSEQDLISMIQSLNRERQNSALCGPRRREYVVKRNIMELVEMLPAPPGQTKKGQTDEDDYQGRSSGSMAWRLARGEAKVESHKSRLWRIPKDQESFELRYVSSKDEYLLTGSGGSILEARKSWQEGVYRIEGGIFRKVENDWKMVYIARSPGAKTGVVQWMFELQDGDKLVNDARIQVSTTVYSTATVHWEIEGFFQDGQSTKIHVSDTKNFKTDQLKGAVKFSLTATLGGSEGDIAWQHAQLFRQSLEATEYSMVVSVNLTNRA